jgi:hypothetical protein
MIVTDEMVSDAVAYLANGGAADAEAAHLAAMRRCEKRGAEVYLMARGSVEERKMRVVVDNEYQSLLFEQDEAKVELTRAKSREKGADKVCDIWRTENANVRAAERVR